MTTRPKVKRYPIRGALYGLLIGLSAAWFIFFQFAMVPFDTLGSVITKLALVVIGGIVLGVVWAYVAPPKRPKGPAPAASAAPEPPAPAEPEPAPGAEAMDDADEGDDQSDSGMEDEPDAGADGETPDEASSDDAEDEPN